MSKIHLSNYHILNKIHTNNIYENLINILKFIHVHSRLLNVISLKGFVLVLGKLKIFRKHSCLIYQNKNFQYENQFNQIQILDYQDIWYFYRFYFRRKIKICFIAILSSLFYGGYYYMAHSRHLIYVTTEGMMRTKLGLYDVNNLVNTRFKTVTRHWNQLSIFQIFPSPTVIALSQALNISQDHWHDIHPSIHPIHPIQPASQPASHPSIPPFI